MRKAYQLRNKPKEKNLEMVKKIKEFIGIEKTITELKKKSEEMKEELRSFVKANGRDQEGKIIWQSGQVSVTLQPTPCYRIDFEKFIVLAKGWSNAIAYQNYMKIEREKLLAGIKAGEVILTKEELEKIEEVSYGKEKVLAKIIEKEIIEEKD